MTALSKTVNRKNICAVMPVGKPMTAREVMTALDILHDTPDHTRTELNKHVKTGFLERKTHKNGESFFKRVQSADVGGLKTRLHVPCSLMATGGDKRDYNAAVTLPAEPWVAG